MSSKKNPQEEWNSKFLGKIFGSIFLLPVILWVWPWAIPFEFFEFWKSKGTVREWLYAAWPIFAWGSGVSFIRAIATRNERRINCDAENIIIGGTIVSILVGVVEEITFRWLFF